MKTASHPAPSAHALATRPRGFFSVPARFGGHVVARPLRAGAFWCHRAPSAGQKPVKSAIFIPCPSLAHAQTLAGQFHLAGFGVHVKPGVQCAIWSKGSPLAGSAPAFACKVELAQGETVAMARSSLACVKCSLSMAASMGAR